MEEEEMNTCPYSQSCRIANDFCSPLDCELRRFRDSQQFDSQQTKPERANGLYVPFGNSPVVLADGTRKDKPADIPFHSYAESSRIDIPLRPVEDDKEYLQ